MTEQLKPVQTEVFVRECREIASALKAEYGEFKQHSGFAYCTFDRHPYAGRAGTLLRQATSIAAELEALRAALSPAQTSGIARQQALQEAHDAMFDIKGDKVTRFDAQTAIRNLMDAPKEKT